MAKSIVKDTFVSKNILNDFYPQFAGVKVFDLQKKHLLYGRIDMQGDAVYVNTGVLRQVVDIEGGPHLAVDFVAAAFSDMRKNIKSAANKGFVSKDSLYPSNLTVHKSWSTGDLEYSYDKHLEKIYTTFVDSYLSENGRSGQIKNKKDFIKSFITFALTTARHFPLTKTGFITSSHCSSFISGLMLEIANESHDFTQQAKVYEYIKDKSFTFFVNEVQKFGFMVDKNAPWRIVFNLASGLDAPEDKLKGGRFYMDRAATSYETVFKSYFRKAYLDEHINLKKKLYSLYEAFYLQFNTYTTDKYIKCFKNQDSYDLRVLSERKDREIPGTVIFSSEKEENEYFLKIILKLRLTETGKLHTPQEFEFHAKEATKRSRLFEFDAGLIYINELTKGIHVTKFLRKGSYWHGTTEEEYQRRKLEIMKTIDNPSKVDYSITGTKNIK
tara:strand:- start:2062 stop:3384 length:1323 start_codon:yes stop_codon:yes gene_type:complete